MQGVLRTKETIDRFKSVPPVQGQTSPLLLYFGTLLSRGKLNAYESVELAILVLSQNKKHLLDNWLRDVRPLPSQYPTALIKEDPQQSCSLTLHYGRLTNGNSTSATVAPTAETLH